MMKRPYKELEHQVRQLEKQVRDLRQEREVRLQCERLQGVLEMAGAICHELNQPMQVLSAYCERVLKTAKTDHSLNGNLKGIIDKIDNMALIVRKLERIASYETKDYMEGKRIIDIEKACRAA